jgi:hypothetical protein
VVVVAWVVVVVADVLVAPLIVGLDTLVLLVAPPVDPVEVPPVTGRVVGGRDAVEVTTDVVVPAVATLVDAEAAVP